MTSNDSTTQPRNSDLIALCDEEIRDLETQLVSLRTKRNALIPIQQLPSEVFEHILGPFGRKRGGSKELISFALVSRYWRDIIFDSKGLWTRIDDSNIAGGDRILHHSNPLPISLFTKDDLGEDVQYILRTASERLQTIHIGQKLCFSTKSPKNGWAKTFPLLESLALGNLPSIPIFRSAMPSLLSLSIHRCNFEWKPIIGKLSILTSLTILDPLEKIPLRTFIKGLDRMPNLGNLVLKDAFVPLALTCNGDLLRSRNAATPIFPQLSVLTISELVPWIILQFLRYGRCITPSTVISISLRQVLRTEGGDMSISQYLEGLQDVFAKVSRSITSIKADQEELEPLTKVVLGYGLSAADNEFSTSAGRGKEESQVIYYEYDGLSRLLKDGQHNHSFIDLKTIHLDSIFHLGENRDISAAAHQYPNLKVLFAHPSPPFLEFFSVPDQDDGHVAWHYPSLETLGVVPLLDEHGIQALENVLTSRQVLSQGKKLKMLLLDSEWQSGLVAISSRLEGLVEEITIEGTEAFMAVAEKLRETVRRADSMESLGPSSAQDWFI